MTAAPTVSGSSVTRPSREAWELEPTSHASRDTYSEIAGGSFTGEPQLIGGASPAVGCGNHREGRLMATMPKPADFRAMFMRLGWDTVNHYGVTIDEVGQWLDEEGRAGLVEDRRVYRQSSLIPRFSTIAPENFAAEIAHRLTAAAERATRDNRMLRG